MGTPGGLPLPDPLPTTKEEVYRQVLGRASPGRNARIVRKRGGLAFDLPLPAIKIGDYPIDGTAYALGESLPALVQPLEPPDRSISDWRFPCPRKKSNEIWQWPFPGRFLSYPFLIIIAMCNTISELVGAAEKLAASFDADVIHPKELPALLERCAKGKKIFSALEALIAGRVAASGNWQSEGDKSPAEFVSRKTGETVRESVDLIQTAKALRELPATDHAFRTGRLTQDQAFEVTSAAVVEPKAEEKLLKVAQTEGLAGVRQEALRVKAAALKDQQDRAERLHRQRYLRTWVDREGAFKLSAQLSPEAGAEVQAVIDAKVRHLLKNKTTDTRDQVAADALVEVARQAASRRGDGRVNAEVKVRVDLEALRRGYLEQGEVCEAEGIPISLEAVGQFLSNSVVKLIGLEGEDVTRVEHLGRYIPPKVKTAVKEKYPKCVIAGCKERVNLELDHTVALGENGKTSVKNLKPLCPKHHRMKHGPYILIDEPGESAYRLVKVKQATAWDEFRTDPSPP